MIKYKTLESVSLSPMEQPLQAVEFSVRPSIQQSRHCVGSGPVRKYKNGLEAHIGDGVTTRIKARTHLQQLDSTEVPRSRLQRQGSETRSELLECPLNLSIDLRLCFIFYYLGLLNYFLITIELQSFSLLFFLLNLYISLINAFYLGHQSQVNIIYIHSFQINRKRD